MLYLRPGVGLVIHDGPTERVDPDTRLSAPIWAAASCSSRRLRWATM